MAVIMELAAASVERIDGGIKLIDGTVILLDECAKRGLYVADRGRLLLSGGPPTVDLYYPTKEDRLRIIFEPDDRTAYKSFVAYIHRHGYRTFDMT